MKRKKYTALAGLAIAALVLTGCSQVEDTTPSDTTEETQSEDTTNEETQSEDSTTEEDEVEETPGNIVEVAIGAGTFTTLATALGAADLVTTLENDGPFTVFAPTDEAFAALPEGLLDALLLPENVGTLQSILTYHVVSGEVFAADVTTGDVPTVEGSTIAVDTSEGVVLNGSVNVTATDIEASNGVIHVIDAVILPPGVDPAALLE